MGLYAWITSVLIWWIAVLRRKAVQKNFYEAINPKIENWLRDKFMPHPLDRKYRMLEVAMWTKISSSEAIRTLEDAKNHIHWRLTGNAWRYEKDNFTEDEKLLMAELACHFDFDHLRKLIKERMSFINYRMLCHLSMDNIANPYPQYFMLQKYNNKWWLACIADYVFRNPRNTGYYLGDRFLTCDLTNMPIHGFKNVYGKVEIEGIGQRELGEQFYYTDDQNYFHYQCNDEKEKNWFQFGFGYLKPNPERARPYLGTSIRKIINTPTYY